MATRRGGRGGGGFRNQPYARPNGFGGGGFAGGGSGSVTSLAYPSYYFYYSSIGGTPHKRTHKHTHITKTRAEEEEQEVEFSKDLVSSDDNETSTGHLLGMIRLNRPPPSRLFPRPLPRSKCAENLH